VRRTTVEPSLAFLRATAYMLKRVYANAIPSVRLSVRPSVRHTGGSVKNASAGLSCCCSYNKMLLVVAAIIFSFIASFILLMIDA